jgi:hypothetical protein
VNANLAAQQVEYRVVEGPILVTRLYVYPSGLSYAERTSRASLLGWPLLHVTMGRCPETGRRKVARGWVAVGRFAFGGVAIGQVAAGLVTVAQVGFGLLLALAQAGLSLHTAAGQVAVGRTSAYGQVAVAATEAVGQVAVGHFALGQIGVGRHVWDTRSSDPLAREHFQPVLDRFRRWVGEPVGGEPVGATAVEQEPGEGG